MNRVELADVTPELLAASAALAMAVARYQNEVDRIIRTKPAPTTKGAEGDKQVKGDGND